MVGTWNGRTQMSKIMASFPRVCPALQAEYGDEPIPVKRINQAVMIDAPCTLNSVCVSDHCYNWHNQGPSVKLTNPKFFIRADAKYYRYVGPHDYYTGIIESKPHGSNVVIEIGRRENGKLAT